jgi:hypothetical protein
MKGPVCRSVRPRTSVITVCDGQGLFEDSITVLHALVWVGLEADQVA